MITIQSRPKAYGYITCNEVWTDTDRSYYEINITAEYLNRPIENVLATLQHEMVHLYCMVNGIQDTSKAGRYHNKNFKAEAEKRGLLIEYVKYIRFLYKGIIINHNKKPSQPTLKRRFFKKKAAFFHGPVWERSGADFILKRKGEFF